MSASGSYSTLANSVLPVYSISHLTGFAPPKPNAPAVKFSSPALQPWLDISQKIHTLLEQSNATFRAAVDQLPLLSVPDDAPIEEWRLAYMILATLAAAYVWGNKPDSDIADRLPYVLARPLREVAEALEVEPGMTYVAGAIWNHQYHEDKAVDEDGQLDTIVSFTGAPDETHFNLTTLRVERAGGEGLVHGLLASQLVAHALHLSVNVTGHSHAPITQGERSGLEQVHKAMAAALQTMAKSIGRCTAELAKMRTGCDPMFFYDRLRPFLAGFGTHPSLPNGVFYPAADGTDSDGDGEWLKLSGSTAGQSSLFQALDLLLTITHPGDQDQGSFVKAMRKAMPGCHVKFLESLPTLPSLRSYIQSLQADSTSGSSAPATVIDGYNAAVHALEGFRNEHIKIVTLYVIGPARRGQPTGTPVAASQEGKQELAGESNDSQLRGTGGSNLAQLLKGMRDDTRRTMIDRE